MNGPTKQELRIALIAPWIARFHNLFPRYDRKPEMLMDLCDDFEAALSDLDPQCMARAFDAWRREGKTFPVPADIRERAIEFSLRLSLERQLPPVPVRYLPAPSAEDQERETERLREEFQLMLKRSKLKEMP